MPPFLSSRQSKLSTAPFSGRSYVSWLLFVLLLGMMLGGCSPDELLNPPRAATQTAQAALAQTPKAIEEPATSAPATEEPTSESTFTEIVVDVEVIEPLVVWINETSAEYRTAAATIGAEFEAQTGRPVALQFISPLQIGDLAVAAQANGRLPDLILHSREQTGALLAAQILDVETATTISAEFDLINTANSLYPLPNGQAPAIPSDGTQLMLFYRTDWIADAFSPPDSFVNIESIAKTFYNLDQEERPEDVKPIAGLAVPTEQNLPSTQRIFEWFAIANGCELVDEKGEVLLYQETCIDTLDTYKNLIFNYSPPDFQTDETVVRAYIDGRTAMMIGTSADVPIIAGANPSYAVTCDECAGDPTYLAANTGVVSALLGNDPARARASVSHARMLGIVAGADAAAADFARFWFANGYLEWLSVEPERTQPFYAAALGDWQQLPSLDRSALMVQVAEQQQAQMATASRWGVPQGHGNLLSETFASEPLIAPLVLRYLGGLLSVEASVQELTDAVTDTIPLYQYYPTPTPEPTEEP